MDRPDIARPKIDMFSIGRCEILEQFDLVSAGRFYDGEFDLSAENASDLAGHFARLMRAMGKFKAENVLPEFERTFEIRNRDTGVIRGDDAKRHISENVQRSTPNVQHRIQKSAFVRSDPSYPRNPRL